MCNYTPCVIVMYYENYDANLVVAELIKSRINLILDQPNKKTLVGVVRVDVEAGMIMSCFERKRKNRQNNMWWMESIVQSREHNVSIPWNHSVMHDALVDRLVVASLWWWWWLPLVARC
jgi:hypothetical protein